MSLVAVCLFHGMLPPYDDIPYVFSFALLGQVVTLVIISNTKILRYQEGFPALVDATLLQSMAWVPLSFCGGFSQSANLVFVLPTLLGSIMKSYKWKSLLGVMIGLGLDGFLLYESRFDLFPAYDSPYMMNPSQFRNALELYIQFGALYIAIYALSLLVNQHKPQHIAASSTNNSSSIAAARQNLNSKTPSHSEALDGKPTLPHPSGKLNTFYKPNSAEASNTTNKAKTGGARGVDSSTLEGVLESIVFFLSKNFKSLTATGFLSSDGGVTFGLNAFVSKKEKFINKDAVAKIGAGMIGSAALKENGFMSGDLKSYPETIEYYAEKINVNSLMAVRITNASGRIIGVLAVDSDAARAFDDDDKDLMFRFSKVASMLVSNVKMSSELKENSRISDLSFGLSKLMSEQLKPNDVLKVLMLNLSKLFNSRRQVLCDVSSASGQGRILHIEGEAGILKRGMNFGLSNANSIYAKGFRNNKTEMYDQLNANLYRFNEYHPEDEATRVITSPIVDENSRPVVVIGVEYSLEDLYSGSDKTLLNTIALNASSSLTKAKIFQKMEKQATIDGLTQISNHRHFQDLMDMEMERAAREKNVVSLLLMDIDHFKKFNDTYGHPVGDLVLKMVSKALQGAVRKTDHIARYGGEEFVVILPQAEGELGRQLAERVRQAIEDIKVPHESGYLSVTMSIGMCTYPTYSSNKAELIEYADQALYYSKEHGRNMVSLHEEIDKRS